MEKNCILNIKEEKNISINHITINNKFCIDKL